MASAMGTRPRDLLDPTSMNPEQLTSTPTKQDLVNEEIGYEDIRRDLVDRMKFVPPDLRVREGVPHWQEDPSKNSAKAEVWNMVEGEILAVKGHMVISTGSSIFQVNASKLRRSLDIMDLEELPDSREPTRAPVLWLSCERSHRCLGAVLSVAAPVDP